MHWMGIILGILIFLVGLGFFIFQEDTNLFYFLAGLSITSIALPFVVDIVLEGQVEQEIDVMFLEFTRNLTESVTTGTPVSKSIVNMRNKDYGSLNPFIRKLANQIELGIPVERALQNFANDIGSPVVIRAVNLIREADRAGGEIDYILESVSTSIAEIDKLKKERKAAIYNLVVQGYIIFFIFIGIMLVMQFKILPLVGNLGGINMASTDFQNTGSSATDSSSSKIEDITDSFLYLLLAQGLFTGLIVGKLAEGSVKAGIKHSFILMIVAFLISSGANVIF